MKLHVGRREVSVSSPDKLLFPQAGLTKRDLIDYYQRIADHLLPHLRGRPLSLHRFPQGVGSKGFYQKRVPSYFPSWIRRVSVPLETGGAQEQVVCDDAATLVYLVNQACVTPHTWLSCQDHLRQPDRLVFDLDPPDGAFELARQGAQALRALLEELGLPALLMTTGSRGLHVAVTLDKRAEFDAVRAFARDVAQVLVQRQPQRYTLEQRIAKRGPRLYLDVARNAYAQTAVPPYAVRARPQASVATPLAWEELDDPTLRPDAWDLRSIFQRLERSGDPWAKLPRGRSLTAARQRVSALMHDTG